MSELKSRKADKINPLTYLTYVLNNVCNDTAISPTPDDLAKFTVVHSDGRLFLTV